MTLLLAVSVWMLLLWLATGLCAAARLGDRTRIEVVSGDLGQAQRTREVWEPAGHVTGSGRPDAAAAHDRGANASLAGSSLAA